MCLSSFKYGRIACKNIDKNSFLDFGTDDDGAKKWSEEVYGEWAKHYSSFVMNVQRRGAFSDYWNTHDPLSYYCGCAYDNANAYYYSKGTGNEYFDSLKTEINSIIEDAPRIPDNIVVYRALKRIDFWNFKELNGLRMPFVHLGPMSTSLTSSILTKRREDPDFSACRYALRIYVPMGARALYVDEVGKYIDNLNRGEIELLFPSDSELYMVSYPYKLFEKTVIDCYLAL